MAYSRPPLASAASSSGSDRSHKAHTRSHPRSNGSGGGKSKRRVRISDGALAELAVQTEGRIHWADILRDSLDEAGNKQWKWIDNMGQFSLYSKTEAGRYAVMASGVLSCSVPEVVHLLHTPHAEQFLQSMEGLYGEDFKDGAFVHRVNLPALEGDGGVPPNGHLLDLSVKSALFGNDQKWSFLDASYRRLDGSGYEKLMTTLDPRDVEGSDYSESGQHHKHNLQNVVTAFTVQPEVVSTRERSASEHSKARVAQPWKETRVFFYAEVLTPSAYTTAVMQKQPSGRISSPGALAAAASTVDKAVKQRVLTMARSCERLTELVRRRRLGLHETAERKKSKSLFSAPSRCLCCNKSVVFLAAKNCRLCTEIVCTECSRKHERETYTPGSQRILVEDVRVCDRCMDLVDHADLPELDDQALLEPVVKATPTSTPAAPSPAPSPSPQTSLLTELLNNELLHAETDARKASVMSVIKSMLEQDQLEQEHHEQFSSTKRSSVPNQGNQTRNHAASRSGGIMLMPTTPDSGATQGLSKLSIH